MATLDRRPQTVVATPRWAQILLWTGLPALGAGAGWLLAALAGWVASLPWAPLQGMFRLIDSAPEPAATAGALALGGCAGLLLAYLGNQESLVVTVTPDRVTVAWKDRRHTLARAEVGAVFLDRRELVLLDRSGRELARETCDQDADQLAAAFTRYGYAWHPDGDPHRPAYRRWVPDLPGLPAGADPLLKARQRALAQSHGEEARELRSELARLGVMVRDEEQRQHVRRSDPPAGEGTGG